MYCAKCGKFNEDNSAFCSACGTPLNSDITAEKKKKRSALNNRLRFAISVVIGYAFFYILCTILNFFVSKFGGETFAVSIVTRNICRLFALLIPAFAGIPVMIQNNRCNNLPFIIALILEGCVFLAFLLFAPVITKLYISDPAVIDLSQSALKWIAIIGLIFTAPLIPLSFVLKKNAIWKDVIIYAAAFCLSVCAMFICSVLHLSIFVLLGLSLGIFFPAFALVPCARKCNV